MHNSLWILYIFLLYNNNKHTSNGVHGLSESEEHRLIMNSDISVIDDKLRELPGGVLIPPEPEDVSLPMPTMDPALPKTHRTSFDAVPLGRIRSALNKQSPSQSYRSYSTSRMLSDNKAPWSSSSRRSPRPLVSSAPTDLEMGMKRIEIMASRAGFNMSSLPRRSQLQIVTRLSDKLPLKMSQIIKKSLKSNDKKIFEFLPEPSRDPLIEDNPTFLSHFIHQTTDTDDYKNDFDFAESSPPKKVIDTSKISIAEDNRPPSSSEQDQEETEAVVTIVTPPILPLPKPSALTRNVWSKPKRVQLGSKEVDVEKAIDLETEKIIKGKKVIRTVDELASVEEELTTSTTTTTTPKPTTKRTRPTTRRTTTTTTEEPEEPLPLSQEEVEEPSTQSTRMQKSLSKPIRVSIISKDTVKEPEEGVKYVEVEPVSSSKNSSLLFQVEKAIADEPSDDYDLTEDEIAAMVQELKKYEGNSVDEEFDYSRLLSRPHPLEFPDHPEHPPSPAPSTTTNTSSNVRVENNYQHFPMGRPFGPGPRPRPPPHHHHHGQFHNHRRPPPPPGPVLRINQVKVSEMPKTFNKECDYFSNELCLLVQDYPIEAISEAVERNPDQAQSLLRPESTDPSTSETNKFAGEGGFLCPSKVAYGKIKKAKSSSTGKWKFVVNYGDKTQTVRIEKCLTPGDRCSYVMPHYRTGCTQVYNYHRLLAWDPDNGLHIDLFKVPTCCTCHVQGYYMPNKPLVTKRRMMLNQPPPPLMMNRFSRNRVERPPPPQLQSENTKDDDDLQDLLKQYSAIRDKIAKKKSGDRSSRALESSLNLIKTVLRKRKRSNLPPLLLKKPHPPMTKQLNLQKTKQEKQKARLSWLVNLLKNKKRLKKIKAKQSKVNYNYHPIMDYYKNKKPNKS